MPHTLLICTVGGSPEPIVAALKHWQPSRIHFLPTPETRPQVADRITPLAAAAGFTLDPGRYDLLELPDGQDFTRCVETIRELTPDVERWLARGPDFDAVVDFTGGTKCMSAALVLQAHRWRCRFAYVGGSERTRDNVGVVVSGKEQILHTHNPWDALGYQAAADAAVLFDQGALAAAGRLLERAVRNTHSPARKRELLALKLLADAYDAWDRFEHQEALGKLKELGKFDNDLAAVLGRDRAERARTRARAHAAILADLVGQDGPTAARVKDLLANAGRRRREGRLDDAVARLYRAVEATAQARLRDAHGFPETACVSLDLLPEALRLAWAGRAADGTVALALQDDYALLLALGDELGEEFRRLGLHDRQRSPLASRNRSILAHGFDRAGEEVFRRLWDAALCLARLTEADLPAFPRLADTEG